jgi:alkylhydroperoxidase family enzyme
MQRIEPDRAQREGLRHYVLPDGRPLELFWVLAANPAVFDALRQATTAYLRDGTLPIRDREVLILRTLARVGAEAEWAVHVELFGRAAGLSEADLAGISNLDRPLPADVEGELCAFADMLVRSHRLDDSSWNRLAARYAPAEVMEMTALVGQYQLVGMLNNVLGLEPPQGLPGFPDRTA